MLTTLIINSLHHRLIGKRLESPSEVLSRVAKSIETMFNKSNLISEGIDLGVLLIHGNQGKYIGANQDMFVIHKTETNTNIKTLKGELASLGKGANSTTDPFEFTINQNSVIVACSSSICKSANKEFNLNIIQQRILNNIEKAGTEIGLAIKEAYYDSSFESEGDILIAGVKIS